jgi:hypothetical protein
MVAATVNNAGDSFNAEVVIAIRDVASHSRDRGIHVDAIVTVADGDIADEKRPSRTLVGPCPWVSAGDRSGLL